MRALSFINEKGGTGKTTLAVNVAAYFAREEKRRVLLLDLDTQGHAGKALGLDVRTISPHIFHLLTEPSLEWEAVVQRSAMENLDVVSCYREMSEFSVAVASDRERALRLERRLREPFPQSYDLVVMDSPPTMGVTAQNVLLASHAIVVPMGLTYLAFDGCAEIVRTLQHLAEEYHRPELKVALVVPTLYRKTSLADEILARLASYFPDRIGTPLPFNVKIDEAQSHGKTIWEYAPKSVGAAALRQIAQQIGAAVSLQTSSPQSSVAA
jgi:chromosome partitioning protein